MNSEFGILKQFEDDELEIFLAGNEDSEDTNTDNFVLKNMELKE